MSDRDPHDAPTRNRRRRSGRIPHWLLAAVAVLALAAAGCSDEGGEDAGSAGPGGSVIFGSGAIPEGFPDDFPIPDGAAIGSTLADGTRNRYEVNMVLLADQDAVVVFYEANLPNAGYEISASEDDFGDWRIDVEKGDVTASVLIVAEEVGVSSVAIDLTTG